MVENPEMEFTKVNLTKIYDLTFNSWLLTLSGVRAYMVKIYLQVEMYTIFDDFIRINANGIKKTTCSNFVSVQIMFV
jgi:hypothetical protein